ncbi:MAG: DEAD/DEAH box helicase [Candidatus Nanoarchaeia archaeon]
MDFNKEKLELRLYQQTILASAIKQNTLVVLPTGLGKTHIAIALAGLLHDKGKILIMAPTLPLVNQHYKTFSEFFSPASEIAVLSGKVKANERAKLWEQAKLILATPQTIRFDIISGSISLANTSLVVFDEAHRAVGNYAYVFVAKAYMQQRQDGRILALTASPGSEENVDEVCKNLFIEKIEARDRTHPEVLPYVKDIYTKFVLVDLTKVLLEIKNHLEVAITARVNELSKYGITNFVANRLTRKMILALKQNLQAQFMQDKRFGHALSLCASIIKLQHAHSLLSTESLQALRRYFEQLWFTASRRKTRALSDLVNDFRVRAAYSLTIKALENGLEHPKLAAVKEVVETQLMKKPNSKILVFTEFRDNVPVIVDTLCQIESAKVHKFIGQASRFEKGMNQKTQMEVIERFKSGELNVLVCTSVGEEGIDIPDVDLVVFYSPLPSVIRTIQRRGRTGRTALGQVIMLVTKGTKDEAYYWTTKRREENLRRTIAALQNSGKLERQITLEPFSGIPVVIFADSRESEIAEILHQKGVKVNLAPLRAGDFILSEDVGCERKDINDFVKSLLDGRLFDQVKRMKENFAKPFIILEGNYDLLFTIRNIQQSALFGALASLILDWGIPILITKNKNETAELLTIIAKREQLEKKKSISTRGSHKPQTLPEMQQYFIEGLPQIGPEAAKALLQYFKNPKNIVNASVEELKKVSSIGEKKAKLIKEILDEEWRG